MGMSVPGYSCSPCRSTTSNSGCVLRLAGECVYYSGSNIAGPGINTGDNLNVVVNKLAQNTSGGTVTSVAASIPSGAIAIAGSPITSSGTLAFTYTGTTSQYVRGDGSLATFPTIPTYTANNGLTMASNNTQLGGTLVQDTTIDATGSYTLTVTGTKTTGGSSLIAQNTSSGRAITATSVSGIGLYGTSVNSIGVLGDSSGSVGVWAESSSSNGLYVQSPYSDGAANILSNPATNNSVHTVLKISRMSTNAAGAAGIGCAIDFHNNDTFSVGSIALSNRIISKFTDPTDNSEDSQFEIWGKNNGIPGQHLTIKSTGQHQLNNYGSGTFTGTATYALQVDASGNIIEGAVGGGSTSTSNAIYQDFSESESLKQPYEFTQVASGAFPDWYDGIGVAVFEEKLIVFGGWNSGLSVDTIYESDDQGVTWSLRGTLPYATHTPAYINASDGYTYIIGGDYLNTTGERSSVYRTRDFLTFELRTASSPFGDRVLHAAAELNGVLYCGGGQFHTLNAADGLFTDIYKSEDHGATWTLVSNTLTFMGKNISGSLRTFNNRIYLVGGGIYDNNPVNKTFDQEVYSTSDGIAWYQEEDIPMAGMQYLNTFVWDGKLWIAGGSINTLNLNVTAFMDKSGVWHDYLPPALITANHAAGTITFRDKAYVILGNNTNLVWSVGRVGNIYYEGRQVFKSETAIDILRRNSSGYNIDAFSSTSMNENRYTNLGGVNYEKWNGTTLELWPNNVKKYEFNVNGTFYASSLLASTLTTVPYTGTYYNTTLQTNQSFPGIAWIGADHRFIIGLDGDLVGLRLEDNSVTGIRFKHKLTTGQVVIEGSSTNGIDASINPSAQLAVKSTTRGFIPPIMTETQRDAIPVGLISTATITNAGTGYTNGNYNAVPLTGGNGTGAMSNVVISGGVLTSILIINMGTGYNQGDVVSVNSGDVGGTGSGIQITISIHELGMMIYNSTTNKINFYNGSAWEAVTSA
jgi:hypothetical protein